MATNKRIIIYPDDSDRYDLFRANYMNYLAHSICDVQPMNNIGDPTRGMENIFTITYSDIKYEYMQYEQWEYEGGYVRDLG
jgi:hypothetical protein